MDKVARMAPKERNELFSETAAVLGITPAVVEKDFWVSWVLKKLFEDPGLAPLFIFKGGTSLSKVYGLIERFSEDIDLVLDWRQITEEDPLAPRSNTKQDKFNKAAVEKTIGYVATTLLPALQNLLGEIATCSLDEEKTSNIQIVYPAAFPDNYLRPQVLLEIGALSAWAPSESRRISTLLPSNFLRFSSNLIARYASSVPGVRSGIRRQYCTTKPVVPKVSHRTRAIHAITTIWPVWPPVR